MLYCCTQYLSSLSTCDNGNSFLSSWVLRAKISRHPTVRAWHQVSLLKSIIPLPLAVVLIYQPPGQGCNIYHKKWMLTDVFETYCGGGFLPVVEDEMNLENGFLLFISIFQMSWFIVMRWCFPKVSSFSLLHHFFSEVICSASQCFLSFFLQFCFFWNY